MVSWDLHTQLYQTWSNIRHLLGQKTSRTRFGCCFFFISLFVCFFSYLSLSKYILKCNLPGPTSPILFNCSSTVPAATRTSLTTWFLWPPRPLPTHCSTCPGHYFSTSPPLISLSSIVHLCVRPPTRTLEEIPSTLTLITWTLSSCLWKIIHHHHRLTVCVFHSPCSTSLNPLTYFSISYLLTTVCGMSGYVFWFESYFE